MVQSRQITHNNIIGRIALQAGYLRLQTHSELQYFLPFRGNNGYANAPQSYVTHILPVLFIFNSK